MGKKVNAYAFTESLLKLKPLSPSLKFLICKGNDCSTSSCQVTIPHGCLTFLCVRRAEALIASVLSGK